MIESMLQKCGYKTGLFTSPHLVDVRERIRLQGCVFAVTLRRLLAWPPHVAFLLRPTSGLPTAVTYRRLLAWPTHVVFQLRHTSAALNAGDQLPYLCSFSIFGLASTT